MMKKDYKTGDEVGKELAKAGVRTVILNACNSASFQHHNRGGNLAEVLLGYGTTESVLAMAYEVVEEAVEIFMNVFYQSLLIEKVSVQDAARMSRLALRMNRSRRASYMYNVQLSDYIVPVLYTSYHTSHPVEASTNSESRRTDFSQLKKIMNSFKTVSPIMREIKDAVVPIQRDLTGRDSDILSLELLLSITRVILLHGQGGCGKSELLRYVCRWWEASGWIKDSAYIDFTDKSGSSLEDFLDQIGNQLGLDRKNRSEDEIVGRLQSGKYLIIFDSADALDTPISLDLVSTATELPMQLKSFIDAATRVGSMVIVSSRQDNVNIANIIHSYQKYHLTGISVLDSVDLLLHLVLEPQAKLVDTIQRRENIDYLRRIAILLEGNPGAIQIIAPALKRANFDGKTLLNELLYGVWNMYEGEWKRCRFVYSIYSALSAQSFVDLDETGVTLSHLSVFWTLIPQNLDYYYWFLYLYSVPYREGSYGYWITQDFQELIEKAQTSLMLRKHWPSIESRLLRAGILEHAVIRMSTGEERACYHMHPILTLIGRSCLTEEALREAKFAYVRQMLLWDRLRNGSFTSRFVSVKWNGTEQHEDYVHNQRAVAMAWSMDGDVDEEVERMGLSMFHSTYRMSITSFYVNQRQPVLFIPLMEKHLLEIHMLTALVRPRGVPTRSDLGAILTFSHELVRFQTHDSRRLALVTMALEAAERYRASEFRGTKLSLPYELSWFQLRHAEADIAESNSPIARAKKLYERNLADDPSSGDIEMFNAIKRIQLQNLTSWASCVAQILAREGVIDNERVTANMREVCNEFKPGALLPFLSTFLDKNEKAIEAITVSDQFSFAIQREPDKVAQFGTLANSILAEPVLNAFADVAKAQGLPPSKTASVLSQMIEPTNPDLRATFASAESALRMLSGDHVGAASALKPSIQREALSSTDSTGWASLADIHMQMYALAVTRNDNPDYRKGLTHLIEWWKQHGGINVPKRHLCFGHLKFAICYNGLSRVVDAARAAIECARIVPTMTTADCAEGDSVEGFAEWLFMQFSSLEALIIFLDPKVASAAPPTTVAELSRQERVEIHGIIKKAYEAKKASEGAHEADAASEKTLEDLRQKIEALKGMSESDAAAE